MILLLIRHAKAAVGERDHARPLSARGREQAPRMGAWIAGQSLAPALVLCSDAARTRETLDLMLPRWAPPPVVRHLRPLYHASSEAILATLAEEGTGESVAVVGHNPGLGDLALRLAREAPAHPRWGDFPTCFVAALRVEGPDPRDGTAALVAFAVPDDVP